MSIATDAPTTCGVRSRDEEDARYTDAPFPFCGCAVMVVVIIALALLTLCVASGHGCATVKG